MADASPKERTKLAARDELRSCLGTEFKAPEKKTFPWLGVTRTRADDLIDTDKEALHEIRQRIARARVLFPIRSS